jgi:hypothetical protein
LSKNPLKKHLHTTVSEEVFNSIDDLVEVYGSKQRVIEVAIQHLLVKHHLMDNIKKRSLDEYQIWHLMRDDFLMMSVGRRTFLSYISEIPQEAIQNNNAVELIEWYYDNISIDELNLFQILKGIKQLWIAGNYFRKVEIYSIPKDIEPLKAKEYKMIFSHDFDDKRYGTYWSQYFKYVLECPLIGAKVSFQTRSQSFHLQIVKKPNKNKT